MILRSYGPNMNSGTHFYMYIVTMFVIPEHSKNFCKKTKSKPSHASNVDSFIWFKYNLLLKFCYKIHDHI